MLNDADPAVKKATEMITTKSAGLEAVGRWTSGELSCPSGPAEELKKDDDNKAEGDELKKADEKHAEGDRSRTMRRRIRQGAGETRGVGESN